MSLPLGDQRADLGGRLERVADRQRGATARDGLDDAVVPARGASTRVPSLADLPVVEQGGAEERLEDLAAQVGVVEDDRR